MTLKNIYTIDSTIVHCESSHGDERRQALILLIALQECMKRGLLNYKQSYTIGEQLPLAFEAWMEEAYESESEEEDGSYTRQDAYVLDSFTDEVSVYSLMKRDEVCRWGEGEAQNIRVLKCCDALGVSEPLYFQWLDFKQTRLRVGSYSSEIRTRFLFGTSVVVEEDTHFEVSTIEVDTCLDRL